MDLPLSASCEKTGVHKPWLKQNAAGGNSGKGGSASGQANWNPAWSGREGGKGQPTGGIKIGSDGKGRAGGKGKYSQHIIVPEDFDVNEASRYSGTVLDYDKHRGCGWISLAQKDVVPEDKVFAHWKQLVSDDRFPFLVKDGTVEFGLSIWKDNGKRTVKAKEITAAGGQRLAMQDDEDAKHKIFVGGQYLRYTGMLQFFSPERGFGYVKMDDGFAFDEEVPQELRVELTEVNAGGCKPENMRDLQVEFGIYKDKKQRYKVYNMTLPGGTPLRTEVLERRIVVPTGTVYRGTVVTWAWRGRYGYIEAEASAVFTEDVNLKLAFMAAKTREKGKDVEGGERAFYFRQSDCVNGFKVEEKQIVSFQVYTDEKGAGACQITMLAPAPAPVPTPVIAEAAAAPAAALPAAGTAAVVAGASS